MKNSNYLVLLTPLVVFTMLECLLKFHKFIYLFVSIANLLVILTIFIFCRQSKNKKDIWAFLILPLLYTNMPVVYGIFISMKWIIHLIFIFDFLLLFNYFKFIYLYLFKPGYYKPQSIENLSFYSSLLISFLIFASAFAFQSFLDTPIWQNAIFVLFSMAIVLYQLFWSAKTALARNLVFIFVISLVFVELYWAASFLTFNFNVSGLIMTSVFYMTIGLTKSYLLEKLDKNTIKIYLTMGLATILLVVLTSEWLNL